MDPFIQGFIKEAAGLKDIASAARKAIKPAALAYAGGGLAAGAGLSGAGFVVGQKKGKKKQGIEDAKIVAEYLKQDMVRDAENMSRALEEGFRQGFQYAGAAKPKKSK